MTSDDTLPYHMPLELRFGSLDRPESDDVMARLNVMLDTRIALQSMLAATQLDDNTLTRRETPGQIRRSLGKKQTDICAAGGPPIDSVRDVEQKDANPMFSTLQQYVHGLGGTLEITARFNNAARIRLDGKWAHNRSDTFIAATENHADTTPDLSRKDKDRIIKVLSTSTVIPPELVPDFQQDVRILLYDDALMKIVEQQSKQKEQHTTLTALRKALHLSPQDLAETGHVTLGYVTALDHETSSRGKNAIIGTTAGYIRAMGAEMELIVTLPHGEKVIIDGMAYQKSAPPDTAPLPTKRSTTVTHDQTYLAQDIGAISPERLDTALAFLEASINTKRQKGPGFPPSPRMNLRPKTLRQTREERSISCAALALAANAPAPSIAALEGGKNIPILSNIERHIRGLNGTFRIFARLPDHPDTEITGLNISYYADRPPQQGHNLPKIDFAQFTEKMDSLPQAVRNSMVRKMDALVTETSNRHKTSDSRKTKNRPQASMEDLRAIFKLTAKDLAGMVGIAPDSLRKIETGQTTPRLDTLEQCIKSMGGTLIMTAEFPGQKPVEIVHTYQNKKTPHTEKLSKKM